MTIRESPKSKPTISPFDHHALDRFDEMIMLSCSNS